MSVLYHFFNYKFLKLGIFMEDGYITRIFFLNDRFDLDLLLKSNRIRTQSTSKYSYNLSSFMEGKNEFVDIDNQLKGYLDGKLKQFDIHYVLNTTPFISAVLKETVNIPYGNLSTYKEIAERIGNPKSYRAVGNALACNPLPIIIPCHRVIRSNGNIGGFGGNPELKRKLLQNEGVYGV